MSITTIKLTVNGQDHEVTGEAGRSLVDVLRSDLGLPGSREGCGIGICGACTVLVDGKPMSGCLLLAEQAMGKQLTTVEGLPPADSLHRVQQAFIDHRAFQCAYCTPGFILSTVALLDRNPSPTDDEIVEALSASLCRCGSYRNILGAVQSLRSS